MAIINFDHISHLSLFLFNFGYVFWIYWKKYTLGIQKPDKETFPSK